MKFRIILFIFIVSIALADVRIAQEKVAPKQKTRTEILQEEIQKRPESAELHLQLGIEYLNSSDSENAEKELELSKKLFGKDTPFLVYRKLGEVYYDQNKYEEAKQEFLKAQEKIPGEWESKGYLNICIARIAVASLEKAPVEEIATAEYKLAEAYYEKGWYRKPKSIIERLIEKSPENQTYKKMQEKIVKAEIADTLLEEGNGYSAKSDYKQSIEKYMESLAIYKEIGNRYGEAACLGNMVGEYQSRGDIKKALELTEQALAIHKEIGDKQGEANELSGLGNIYSIKGDNKKALELNEKALSIYKEIGDRSGEANRLGALGNIYSDKGDYKYALEFSEKSLAIYKGIGERSGEANNLNRIGKIYSDKGDYKNALEFSEKSLAIDKEIGNKSGEANDLMSIGSLYSNKGDYAEALKYYENALAIDKEIGYRLGEADSLGMVGEIYWYKGDYYKALKFQEKSLVIHIELGSRNGEAGVFMSLGNIYGDKGEYKKALEFYEKSLAIKKEIGDRDGESRNLINIGTIYRDLGDYEKYLQSEEEALKIAKQIDSRYVEMFCYMNLGEYHLDTGDIAKAIENYNKALALAESLGVNDRIAWSYYAISKVYRKNKDYPKAIQNLNKAISLYKKIEKKPSLVFAYFSYARIYLEQKKSGAKQYIQKAEELEKVIGRKPQLAEIHLLYAQDFLISKKFPEAEKEARAALKIAEELGMPATTWEADKTLGDIQLAAGKKKESIQSYQKSIAILRSMYSLLGEKKQTSFMQDKLEVYEKLVSLLMKEGKSDEAQKYLEESKQFILRASGSSPEVEVKDEKTRAISEELKVRKRALDNLEKKLGEANNPAQVEALKETKHRLFREFQNKFEELRNTSDEGKNLYETLSLNAKSTTDFRKTLAKNSILIEYAVLENVTYIFWITKDKQGAVKVDISREKIGDLVHELRKEITSNSDKSEVTAKLSNELHTHLIAPVLEHFQGKKHIIFIPYGVLYFLPFEALHRKDGKFLVESYDISYYTNTSAIRLSNPKKKIANSKQVIIAFGNPDGSLKGSEKEVDAISGIYPNSSLVLKKETATLAKFKKDAKNYYIVHLSTHGVLESPPSESHIIFGKDLKDKLRFLDIQEFQADSPEGWQNTQLVVMSACSTAIEKRGFDVRLTSADYSSVPLSLTSAFESISVYSVISTLWDVSDSASKDLMVLFYEKMKANNYETGKALSEAKREFIKYQRESRSIKANPYYWAGFILTGDYR